MQHPLRLLLPFVVPVLAACADHVAAPEPIAPAPAPPAAVQALECSADVRALALRCAAPDPSAGTASGAIIGGQGTNVLLTGTNLAYDPAAGEFRLDATIRNLMAGRTLGTYDGSGVAGIRLFFHSGPTAVEGEGEVGIINTDGSDLFLAWGEPFFTYASMLGPDQETEPRRWRFSVPPGVARFRFGVYLEAPVWDGATRTDVLGAFTQVTAGFSHSCGLTDDRRIFCWGDGADGRLGHGGTSLFLDPVEVDAGNREWRLVSAGKEHTCGVTTEDEGVCWGKGSGVSTGDMVVDSLDAGGTATCATAAGTTYCWGTNEWGQLGMGDTLPRRKPEPVAGGHTFVTVRVGTNHTCALTAEGEAWCWGMNARGQLGAASAQSCGPHFPYPCSTTPVRVDTELRFARIDAGAGHTCALTAEGEAYCWGENVFGQVGDGSTDDVVPRPAAVVTEMRFAQVAAMDRNSCGIQADGVADCWGANPSSVTQSVDDVVAGERWRSIAGMDVHMCLAAADGQGYCSGREQFGELGNLGTHQNTANPRAALAPLHVFDLPPRAGFDHSGDGSADVVFNAREDHFHRFFATYSDDDFGIEQRLWSFGDGTTGKGNWIRHVYTANGTYTVTLTVVDAAGQRAMTQRTVWVTSLP